MENFKPKSEPESECIICNNYLLDNINSYCEDCSIEGFWVDPGGSIHSPEETYSDLLAMCE